MLNKILTIPSRQPPAAADGFVLQRRNPAKTPSIWAAISCRWGVIG